MEITEERRNQVIDHVKALLAEVLDSRIVGKGQLQQLLVQLNHELNKLDAKDFTDHSTFFRLRARVGHYASASTFAVHEMIREVRELAASLDTYKPNEPKIVHHGDKTMKVILTWSKPFSKQLALFLRDWLPEVLPGVKTWVSSEDIQKGKKWFPELMKQFEQTWFLITCITTENVSSPWVYYEVGLIASKQDEGTICPYLVGVQPSAISATPISQFQCTEATKDETWKLILSINTELKDNGHNDQLLEVNFKNHWPKLKTKLEKIISEMGSADEEVAEVHQQVEPELKEPAKKLLLAALKDKHGKIMCIGTMQGVHIQVGGIQMCPSQEPREVAKWKGAVSELHRFGYIEDRAGKGEVFSVTDSGFVRAERLQADDPIQSLPAEAKKILEVASKSQDGYVHFIPNDAGPQLMSGGVQFITDSDPKNRANWIHAYELLVGLGLLEATTYDSIVQMSKKGYEVAKELFS